MKQVRLWVAAWVVTMLSLTGATTVTAQNDYSSLEGEITVDGSSTVAPITSQAEASFRKVAPQVSISVGVSGTGGGFKRFTKGETDISDASRPIKFKEFQACKENGIEFIEIPVAYDGLTIAVSKGNDFVEVLTVEQLQKIFLASSEDGSFQNAKNWSDVDPSWPSSPIKIFSPGTDSGTFDYFKEVMIADDESASIRADMSVSEDDNQLVQGIANTENAIGFFGASYYFSNQDKLKSVKIVNPAGVAVAVSAESIESGEYAPFSRPLFIYVNAKSARRPEVKVFVNHYLDNAGSFAEQVKYVGLPKPLNDAAKMHFQRRLNGTHFWKLDGGSEAKREGSLSEIYTKDNLLK